MARKHPVSPNQTSLWTYHALAPEWGSPALAASHDDEPHGMVTTSSRVVEGRTRAKVKVARLGDGRSVSALTCHRSVSDLGGPLPGRTRRRRSVRHHARKQMRVDHLV